MSYEEQLRDLRNQGLSVKEIAARVGKSERTVSRNMKSFGLTKPADRADIADSDILDAWHSGLTIIEIAKKFGCSHDTVTKRLLKYDVKCDRVSGIKRHFKRTHDDLWPEINADLDSGMCVSVVRDKYHMRYDSVLRLMELHDYKVDNVRSEDVSCSDIVSIDEMIDAKSVICSALDELHIKYVSDYCYLPACSDKELSFVDVYMPDFKLGIDVNSVAAHVNSMRISDMRYHQKKALLAESVGIGLVQVYDDDMQDTQRRAVLMRHIAGLVRHRMAVGARECDVRDISVHESDVFLNAYHFQGRELSARFRYGLFFGTELVAVLCVGQSRYTDHDFEIIRYCVRPDYAVSGGFMKLFMHFIRLPGIAGTVVSYMDLNKRFSAENIYEKSGFELEKITQPDYWWVRPCDFSVLRRYETTKARLVAQGYDSAKSEVEIMRERGYVRMFGAGSKRYVYHI